MNDRMRYFYLDPKNVNSLQPGKRTRQTINPAMALKDGKPWIAFGTPGLRHAAADAAAVLPQRRRVRDERAGGARAADGDQQQLPGFVSAARRQGQAADAGAAAEERQEALAAKGHQLDIRNVKGVGSVKAILIDPRTGRADGRREPDRRQLCDGMVDVLKGDVWRT
jgi:gamma-glutamyltranspeptidase/glutathione hydrolase